MICRSYAPINCQKWKDVPASVKAKMRGVINKIRKKAQDTRSKNKYNHRLSRKGYAGLEEELQKENNTEESFERHTLWTLGRKNKDGAFVDDDVREVAAKIDKVAKQVEEGSLIVEGSNDVFTQALGTLEHCGHVHGIGNGVTPTEFFKKPNPSAEAFSYTIKEVGSMKTMVAALFAEVQRLGGQVPKGFPSTSPNLSKVGSNSFRGSVVGIELQPLSTPPHDVASTEIRKKKRKQSEMLSMKQGLKKTYFEDKQLKEKEVDTCPRPPGPPNDKIKMISCRLALGSTDRIVVHGHLHDIGGSNILHGSQMAEGNARVSIDKLERKEYGHEKLPIPNADARTLDDAVAGFVEWPRKLVILNTTLENRKQSSRKREFDIVAANFASLVDEATSSNKDVAIFVVVSPEVFRTDNTFHTPLHQIPVFRDDLYHVIEFKEIGVAVMKLYMCALYNKSRELSKDHRIRFADPAGNSGHSGKSNAASLLEVLDSVQADEIFLYPYNIGACKKLNYSSKFSNSTKNSTTLKATCPRQSGEVECGYYVMRYMREIIHSPGTHLAELFCSVESYSVAEIDEVRLEFMNFVRDNM